MPDLGKLLKDEIRRLSAREVRRHTARLNDDVKQLKRALSDQRRRTQELERAQRSNSRQHKGAVAVTQVDTDEVRGARLSPGSIKRMRDRYGLSRDAFAGLLGVSPNSVYLWEHGKATPRSRARASLVQLRKLGVREVRSRLSELE